MSGTYPSVEFAGRRVLVHDRCLLVDDDDAVRRLVQDLEDVEGSSAARPGDIGARLRLGRIVRPRGRLIFAGLVPSHRQRAQALSQKGDASDAGPVYPRLRRS